MALDKAIRALLPGDTRERRIRNPAFASFAGRASEFKSYPTEVLSPTKRRLGRGSNRSGLYFKLYA